MNECSPSYYLRLYRTAATAIKNKFSALMVGGPGLGASGSFVNGEFVPTDFATNFLVMCRKDNVPLNFFSWHCYTADPVELSERSWAIRRFLDFHGFTETENHLNEWNFLPGNTWQPITKSGTSATRQRYYEEMAGALGAAFVAASLIQLQDAPIDVCNFYHGELGGFGIFTEQGVPLKAYQALRAFQGLMETPRRVETRGAVAGKLAFVAGLSREWTTIGTVQSDFIYQGKMMAGAGWYSLEVRARREENAVSAMVQRVGVGEFFLVVGHSVAHGGQINLSGATDDRVSTIGLPMGDMESQRRYKSTGDPRFLPEAVGRHFDSNVQPAPAGNGTYFWAAFAEDIAKSQNVPVLLLNAAFGGTSLEHWAKSARGEHFEHPFVNSSIRMPYIRLEHALTKYCAVTGLRAILADQGQNDWSERDEETIIANYKAWIDQARKDVCFANLAVVVNRQSPPDGFGQIRRVQERIIKEHPHCFPGADYDTLASEDTVDKIHLSASGAIKAARLWSDALDADFFKAAVPLQAK